MALCSSVDHKMKKKPAILFLFMVILCKSVGSDWFVSEDNTTVHSTSGSNTTITETVDANETVTLDDTTSDEPNTTFEVTTTKRPIIPLKLPEAFQAVIRLSRTSHPASAYNVIVSYDRKKNRAAITAKDSKNKNRQIYDFQLDRILNIEGSHCQVESISEDSAENLTFPFPFSVINGEKHIGGPLSIFRLDGSDTEMAEDGIFVSGVPCTEYSRTIDIGQVGDCNFTVQCKIRQFFSKSEWKNPNCKNVYCNPMPIRITVECGGCPLCCYYLHLTFAFLEFYEEIKDEEEFQQLPGVYCENARSESFPTLSSSFHATLTEKDVLKKTLSHKEMWWSEDLKVLRVDQIVDDTNTVSLITDYNINASFVIKKLGTECRVKLTVQEKPSILSLLIDSKKEDVKGIQKVGKRRCDLSRCEVWTGETLTGKSFDIYLNSKNSSDEGDLTPVLVDLFQRNEKLLFSRRKFTNYIPSLGELSAFDVTPCFSDMTPTRFELTITGDIYEKWRNPYFRENIYKTIWEHSLLVSPLRLQNFQIVPEANDTLIVNGIIVDRTSVEKVLGRSYVDISSEGALGNIRAMTGKENNFTSDEGIQLKVTAFKIKRDAPKQGGKKYGPGDMGGLAVGMILVGTILGIFLVLILMKKKMITM